MAVVRYLVDDVDAAAAFYTDNLGFTRRPEPGGWNRVVVEVDDLETKVDELKQVELSFRNEVVTGPGGKQILLEGPAGNVVELFQPA